MCDCIISGFLDAKSLFDIFNLSDGKIKYAGMDVLLELCYSGNWQLLISDFIPKIRIPKKIVIIFSSFKNWPKTKFFWNLFKNFYFQINIQLFKFELMKQFFANCVGETLIFFAYVFLEFFRIFEKVLISSKYPTC